MPSPRDFNRPWTIHLSASVKWPTSNHVQSSWFHPVDPNLFGLVIGMSCFEMCKGRRGTVHSLPVLLPCFTSTPYDMLWITHQVLRKMDYSDRIYNTSGTGVKTCGSARNICKRKLTRMDLHFLKSQFVAFFFHQSKLISTQLSTDAELTLGLLPAGSRPRTKSVVVPGLLSLCLCQHSKYSPSIISIDLQ